MSRIKDPITASAERNKKMIATVSATNVAVALTSGFAAVVLGKKAIESEEDRLEYAALAAATGTIAMSKTINTIQQIQARREAQEVIDSVTNFLTPPALDDGDD